MNEMTADCAFGCKRASQAHDEGSIPFARSSPKMRKIVIADLDKAYAG